ncbi:hypothetical protein CSQ94_17875 [Janthinobacterium sp. BJB312]|nr:hypothetical protein CSQ94_17875 [Janthinobacterium sp. BJB312]
MYRQNFDGKIRIYGTNGGNKIIQVKWRQLRSLKYYYGYFLRLRIPYWNLLNNHERIPCMFCTPQPMAANQI